MTNIYDFLASTFFKNTWIKFLIFSVCYNFFTIGTQKFLFTKETFFLPETIISMIISTVSTIVSTVSPVSTDYFDGFDGFDEKKKLFRRFRRCFAELICFSDKIWINPD